MEVLASPGGLHGRAHNAGQGFRLRTPIVVTAADASSEGLAGLHDNGRTAQSTSSFSGAMFGGAARQCTTGFSLGLPGQVKIPARRAAPVPIPFLLYRSCRAKMKL
jgi:hypothetical protein